MYIMQACGHNPVIHDITRFELGQVSCGKQTVRCGI